MGQSLYGNPVSSFLQPPLQQGSRRLESSPSLFLPLLHPSLCHLSIIASSHSFPWRGHFPFVSVFLSLMYQALHPPLSSSVSFALSITCQPPPPLLLLSPPSPSLALLWLPAPCAGPNLCSAIDWQLHTRLLRLAITSLPNIKCVSKGHD